MHRLAVVIEQVVGQIRRLGVRDIALVRLEIGDLVDITRDVLHGHFQTCTRDTPLAGAALELVAVPGCELRLLDLEVL